MKNKETVSIKENRESGRFSVKDMEKEINITSDTSKTGENIVKLGNYSTSYVRYEMD